MVNNVSTFGRSGVHDYLLVRASAIILALYTFYVLGFIAFNEITYLSWSGFYSYLPTQIFSLLALLALLVHAWIGLWQVLTDYVKPTGLRLGLQYLLNIVAFVYVAAGILIIWGL
ncbi:succinate dehydrogenase, hydrophobic membrane anchor protein [Alginatibacterium sediminis]|uniref:Succinate dehydrogenase hydrophobic membrane anchor subunit n=1 Tax=Alginatibacterium sediminis TaxID=2164068 RepID=A0A420EFN6_9ALTE|nr:succinate dehydrogenase, hydrophobic membrane anchor protein [Alginatibacterium sediminis]RKF19519.1 succinate dehydrogenase, hydrophobic membrane anchor protein [Alginatibacterium sediminis]